MTLFYTLIAIVPIIALTAICAYSFKQKSNGISGGKIILRNVVSFALVLVTVGVLTFTVSAATADKAEPAEQTTASQSEEAQQPETPDNSKGLGLLSAALVTAISGIGGGIAVAAGAPAAIAATSENDKSFGKSLIFVALGESIALYGIVISILILNKI